MNYQEIENLHEAWKTSLEIFLLQNEWIKDDDDLWTKWKYFFFTDEDAFEMEKLDMKSNSHE